MKGNLWMEIRSEKKKELSQYDSLIGGGFVVFSMKKRRTYMPAFSMVIFSFHFLTIVSMNSNFLCVSLR